jgi:hypothetical protein
MGEPGMNARGIGNRGTANRRAAAPKSLPWPADYPPFHVSLLDVSHPEDIGHALAYGLKWHLDLMRTQDPVTAQDLVEKLIALWEYLKLMEVVSPRAPEGALLVRDPMAMFSRAKIRIEFYELPTGESIPVTTSWEDAPLPVWQPTLFPPELPPTVRAVYPSRPRFVEEIPPFFPAVISRWMETSVRAEMADEPARPPAPELGETGEIVKSFEVLEPATEIQEDEDAAEKAMEAVARKFDSDRWTVERLAVFKGITPTVNAAIARLRSTNLNDIQRHTGVKFDPAYADVPLIRNTGFILYHSVISFVLDTKGEPFDLRFSREDKAMIDYPILIEGPGEQMRRSVPADDGVYLSVQKYGLGTFRLNDAGITKLLLGTVGGFTEFGYGYSGPHRIQKTLQSYLERRASFVAAVTVPGAYTRQEITWSRIKSRIPEFVDVVVPYLVKEVGKRASYKLENWEAFVTEVLEEVIKEIILDEVKTKVRNYLIKKIGKRIVPGLNAVAALVDLFDGGEERLRIRHIIACMIVALRSNADEDLHIAAKTCAIVMADEFEGAVMNALVKHSKKGAAKLAKKSKAQREADEKAEGDKPKPKEPAPPDQPPPQAKADRPTPPPEPSKVSAAASRPKSTDVTKLMDHSKQGAPQSLGAPSRRDGAQNVMASNKPPYASAPPQVGNVEAEAKAPRPPNKRESEMLERARKKQQVHEEKIAKKIKELKDQEEKKKQEEQKIVVNGDPGTGDENKGTKDKGTDATRTKLAAPAGAPPAKPPRRGKPPGSRQPPPPFKPLSPEDDGKMHVKEPEPPEDTHAVQGERAIRTSSHSDEALGRAQFEKEAGAMGIGEQAHHNIQKKGAGETGKAAREAAHTAGTSVNQPSNMIPAMGVNDDPRAIHGSSAAHSSMHGTEDQETLRRQIETRKSDPEGVARAQADYGDALYEGRRPSREEFYLGGDPEPPEPKKPRVRKPKTEPPDPQNPAKPDPKK